MDLRVPLQLKTVRKQQDEEELEFLEGNPERICKM